MVGRFPASCNRALMSWRVARRPAQLPNREYRTGRGPCRREVKSGFTLGRGKRSRVGSSAARFPAFIPRLIRPETLESLPVNPRTRCLMVGNVSAGWHRKCTISCRCMSCTAEYHSPQHVHPMTLLAAFEHIQGPARGAGRLGHCSPSVRNRYCNLKVNIAKGRDRRIIGLL